MQIVQNSEVTKEFTGKIVSFLLCFQQLNSPPLKQILLRVHIFVICILHIVFYAFMDIYVYNVKLPFIVNYMSKLIRSLRILSHLILVSTLRGRKYLI